MLWQATMAKRDLIVENDPAVAMPVEEIAHDIDHEVLVELALDHPMLALEVARLDVALPAQSAGTQRSRAQALSASTCSRISTDNGRVWVRAFNRVG